MEAFAIILLLGLASLAILSGISQTLTLSWSRNGESISQTVTIEDEGEINRDFTIAPGTDTQKTIAIDISELRLIYIHSTRDIQIDTNAANASGGDTIQIKANKPFVWNEGMGWDIADVFSADVTAMYFTLAAGADATVKIRGVVNATP